MSLAFKFEIHPIFREKVYCLAEIVQNYSEGDSKDIFASTLKKRRPNTSNRHHFRQLIISTAIVCLSRCLAAQETAAFFRKEIGKLLTILLYHEAGVEFFYNCDVTYNIFISSLFLFFIKH